MKVKTKASVKAQPITVSIISSFWNDDAISVSVCKWLSWLCVCVGGYLYNADGFPGQVEAGVEQEREGEREGSVPAHTQTHTHTSKKDVNIYIVFCLEWRKHTDGLKGEWTISKALLNQVKLQYSWEELQLQESAMNYGFVLTQLLPAS